MGRLTFGVGAGWNRTEFDAFGIPYDHRASRFEESFEIVRRLLDGERVTFEGRFHRCATRCCSPPRAAPAADGRFDGRTCSRPRRCPTSDIWNTWFDWYGNTAEGFRAKQREIDDACERPAVTPLGRAERVCPRSAG